MEIILARKISWKDSILSCWKFLTFRKSRQADKGWRIELSLKRLFVFCVFFGTLLYFAAAASLYAWRSGTPHNQVRFQDIVLPWNWTHMKERLSMTNLKRAEASLEEKDYRNAMVEVRAAVSRYPANFEARLLLARMYSHGNQELALQTLRQGYRAGYPDIEDYHSLFLALALRLEDFQALREVVPMMIRNLEAEPPTDERKRRIASLYTVLIQSQMKLNDYVGALRTLDSMDKGGQMERSTVPLRLMLLMRMGSFAEFDRLIARLSTQERARPGIVMLQAHSAYERGEIANAQAYVNRALQNNRDDWNAFLDGIKLLLKMGQVRQVEEFVDLYLYYNASNNNAIQGLAAALTDWPSSYLVNKIKLWSLANNSQMYPMMLFYEVQALFREARFAEAKELYDNWVHYVPTSHKDYRYVEAYKAIFDAVLANSEQSRQRLLDALAAQENERKPFPEEVYWVSADAMRKLGRYDLAETIINRGMTVYPNTLTLGSLRRRVRDDRSGIIRSDGVNAVQTKADREARPADPAEPSVALPGIGAPAAGSGIGSGGSASPVVDFKLPE